MAAILIDPPRATLRAAITARFEAMLADGALAEVEALLALGLDPALPALRAHGVPELAAYLRGELTLAQATTRAILVTGQYTKRQATWFRHHTLATQTRVRTIHARFSSPEQFSERERADLFAFIENIA
jgi:tRNA dimethylallyltransferase